MSNTLYKEKACLMCSEIFKPTTGNQRYCIVCSEINKREKDKVDWLWRGRKRNNSVEYTKNCLSCGIEFKSYYPKKGYCGSDECEVERLRRKNKRADDKRAPVLQEKRSAEREVINNELISERVKYIQSENYKVLEVEGPSSHDDLFTVECPNGHKWFTTFHNFKDSKSRCLHCYSENSYVSNIEQKVRDYFLNNHPEVKIVYNDRTVISPKEIDLYFPDAKVGVELCGLYWHSETANGISKDYHYDKMMKCYEKGVRLITVFEDEVYDNFDIVISRILQALNKTEYKVYGRDCEVREIEYSIANEFINKYHLQGNVPSVFYIGLFHKEELIGVCSIGHVNRQHTSSIDTIELKRLCFKSGYTIIGGANKLFKHIIAYCKSNNFTKIKSYCDMRYANIFNIVYDKMGFKLKTKTNFTPHYFKGIKRFRNISLRKTVEERKTNLTELQLRLSEGYHRIWDCGHRTYEYELIND